MWYGLMLSQCHCERRWKLRAIEAARTGIAADSRWAAINGAAMKPVSWPSAKRCQWWRHVTTCDDNVRSFLRKIRVNCLSCIQCHPKYPPRYCSMFFFFLLSGHSNGKDQHACSMLVTCLPRVVNRPCRTRDARTAKAPMTLGSKLMTPNLQIT